MMQKAFGNECMSKTRIKEWYNRFKGGRTSVDSNSRSGRPWTTKTLDDIKQVRLAIEGDRRLTVRELETYLRIPKTTVWEILNKILGMTRVPAHSSNLVQQFLSKHSIALLRQPPYSPDITPCDFCMFPKLKKPLKGQRFDDKTTVENNATAYSRPSIKVSSRTVSRSGNIARTVLFNQVGITLKDATHPMMKNNASAEI